MTEYLDLEDLIALTESLVGESMIRDVGLLGSAAARPATTVFGEDAYPDIWTKAAALLNSIVGNHPLIDGNKRLGWLATAVFLELNGESAHEADNGDVYELVMWVAEGSPQLEEITQRLRRVCS